MRGRIETTSETLPSTTNNYKGSPTLGFLGCVSPALSPFPVCLSLAPKYVRDSQETFLPWDGLVLPARLCLLPQTQDPFAL